MAGLGKIRQFYYILSTDYIKKKNLRHEISSLVFRIIKVYVFGARLC